MSRILFVDDEQRILDGLRDSLRKERKRWDMTFALGGEAAILLLENESFDVIVSDMRMPKVDGSVVLQTAKRIQPGATRIILSGQTELSAVARMVPIAHQFLTKPCDGEVLKSVLERVLDLTALIGDGRLQSLLGGTENLPAAPRVYAELVETLSSTTSSSKDVSRILSSDPALSAKVLHLTNSAFFGLKRSVSSVEVAVTLLGVDALRGLVLALGAFASLAGKNHSEGIAALQKRAVEAGEVALCLAGAHGEKEAIFSAALIHDVGRLLLMTRLPERYEEVEKLAARDSLSLCAAESLVFGVTHAEAGAYLLGLWGLPANIVEAVRFHHEPSRAPAMNGIAKIVAIAARIADREIEEGMNTSPTDLDSDPEWALGIAQWERVQTERTLEWQRRVLTDPVC